MEVPKTSLSAGLAIRSVLLEAPAVAAITDRIYPVVSADQLLPYIAYRRVSLEQLPVKGHAPGSDAAVVEVICYSQTYAGSVELAENVRRALEGRVWKGEGMTLRSCFLSDSEEIYEGDAWAQRLLFQIKI